MRHEDFNMKEHGFVGHLAEPDGGSDRAVIVIMGGEQSVLPGIKFAERFADYGITGLAVSLFGAEGLPSAPNQIPLDMFIPAVEYLRGKKGAEHISVYSHGSHLNGLMPNRAREKKLYRMIPLIGLMYKTFGKYRKENLRYFVESEREIIDWIMR
ncbi:hypothetical protein SAMN02910369_02164 [Lachnospiraceae bacterium NE2001]|nr:hypothetical protein SAMN02910369_02164 [Lachnospiraceae bacterium NE2001]